MYTEKIQWENKNESGTTMGENVLENKSAGIACEECKTGGFFRLTIGK